MTTGLHPLPSIHVAQVERIEHSYTVLETVVLPLNYTCLLLYVSLKWSRGWDLNPQPTHYKCVAPPVVLPRHIKEVTCVIAITNLFNCTQFEFRIFLMSTGASRRARTFDIRINSASLCQLSYRGINHEGGNPHIIYG